MLNDLKAYRPLNQRDHTMKHKVMEFFSQSEPQDHITGSAWIVNPTYDRVLLGHHKKLDLWLQLGGHLYEGESAFEGALREAKEESGLKVFIPYSQEIFDIDVHRVMDHHHYDLRYLFISNDQVPLVCSEASFALKWVALDKVEAYNSSPAMKAMVAKTRSLK